MSMEGAHARSGAPTLRPRWAAWCVCVVAALVWSCAATTAAAAAAATPLNTSTCVTDRETQVASTGCFTASQLANTLAFLNAFAAAIPALQTAWTGNDFCNWEGVPCFTQYGGSYGVTVIVDTLRGLSGSLPELPANVDGSQVAITQISIDGSHTALTGTLPASWSRLVLLQSVSITNTNVSGTLPTEWSAMAALEDLDLSGNNLGGTLPASWGTMPSLGFLVLDSNILAGSLPAEWGNMANIAELYLDHNKLSGPLPVEWSQILGLINLTLDHNLLSGTLPPEWAKMSFEWGLYLDHNLLNGTLPSEWGKLGGGANDLHLSHNNLTGTLPASWSEMDVYNIELQHNLLTGSIPESWANFPAIYGIILDNNSLCGCVPEALLAKTTDPDEPILLSVDPALLAADCATANACFSTSTTTTTTTTEAPTPAGCLVEGCAQCSTRNPYYCMKCREGYTLTMGSYCRGAGYDLE